MSDPNQATTCYPRGTSELKLLSKKYLRASEQVSAAHHSWSSRATSRFKVQASILGKLHGCDSIVVDVLQDRLFAAGEARGPAQSQILECAAALFLILRGRCDQTVQVYRTVMGICFEIRRVTMLSPQASTDTHHE